MPYTNISSKKALFIASIYTHLATFHIPFMRLLQEKGYEVHAAASFAEGHNEEVGAAGVTCWDIPFARSPYGPGNVNACRELGRLLRKCRYDLIHVHTPVASFIGRYLAKATGQGPVLYTAHGFHFYRGAPIKNWLLYYTAERLAARWTDGLIVMNSEDYENAQKMGFVPGKNLFLVHGVGVDLRRYSVYDFDHRSFKARLGLGNNDVVVTCVAELNHNKNQGFLIQAWKNIVHRHPEAHLLLVGDGKLKETLEKKIRDESVRQVHLLGYRADVPQILQVTDIATLVSMREGLPKSIMEAMAAGKPVVATNIRGNRDLVEHGRTGLLVELGDVQGLTRALERLVAEPELRTRMGETARQKIQDYSLDRVLVEMEEIYGRYLKW